MPPLTESAEGDLIYDTVGFDLDRLRHARGTAALSPERAELAAQILTRVLEHGLGRVAARQAAAVRQLTPQEVMAAVRAAFAQREPKSRPRTRLHRTKRH